MDDCNLVQSQQRSKKMETLVLFPGALGDFLCVLPALVALRDSTPGSMTIAANGDWLELLDLPDATGVSLQRREIADLFRSDGPPAPATRELLGGFRRAFSWTGHGDANFQRRLTQLARDPASRVGVFPFRGMNPGEHAASWFGRCLDVDPDRLRIDAGATTAAVRRHLVVDRPWLAEFTAQHRLDGRPLLAVHPGSGSPRKNWPGFADALARWQQDAGVDWIVLEIRGPAEAEAPSPPLPGALRIEGLALPRIAAVLERADAYLGNDSGISHLAGIAGTRGLALFGPSDPTVWRPLGGRVEFVHRPDPCPGCGDVLCLHRISPAEVAARLDAATRT
jgi:hypothetical protein